MTLKCTVDGRAESLGHLISVCHHCGKPICEQHGWVVSADEAFDDSAKESSKRVQQSAVQSAKRVPQPAMHCKQCVDDQHKGASKHPGWADPKEVQRAAQAQAAQAVQAVQQPVGGQPWAQQGQPGPQQGQQWGPGPQQGQQWGQQGQPGPQQGQQWGQSTGTP
jgi:hypothetical protein